MRTLFWWRHVFSFVEGIDKSGVSSLCGNSVEDILSNCQTVFHSRGRGLLFHQQWAVFSVFSVPHYWKSFLFERPAWRQDLRYPG